MKSVLILVSLLTILPSVCLAGNTQVPHLINSDTPPHGVKTLDLKELWRAGGEDEEVIFGRIVDVKRGPDGSTYVLDNQLCQVAVFSPEGQHLSYLSREGDGPGELRQPVELAFLSDDILGIGMGFPGKVISLKLDGTPDKTYYPIGEPSEGNIGLLMGMQFFDGVMAACGGRMVFGEDGTGHTDRFLSFCQGDCTATRHLLEKATPLDLTGRQYVEAPDHYVERTWALGPGGMLFVAAERDAYEISVFDKTGKLVQVFGRKYKPRKRTKAEKQQVTPVINFNNSLDTEIVAEDYDPCISRLLYNRDESTVWVQTPQGEEDQTEEILELWDVFSADGKFQHQVIVPLGHEMNDGTIHLVGGNKLIVVKGTSSPFNDSENTEEEMDVEPLEVICYEIR